MKRQRLLLAELTVLAMTFATMASAQATWYVATNGAGNGASWTDATNSIQGAIDASSTGDTVLVSNGVYETGGIANYPVGSPQTNRVVIWKAITLRSANNNPTNTVIKGAWDLGATNGPAAVRCVYMTAGSLIGFTVTNGATLGTGDYERRGGGVNCASTNMVISNCVIVGNAAHYLGGGAIYGTLYNCTIADNTAGKQGGGAYGSTLHNCTVSNNYTPNSGPDGNGYGSGVSEGIMYNCVVVSNSGAYSGGGIQNTTAYSCSIIGNRGSWTGGGAANCNLFNCLITGNWCPMFGGGVENGTMYNCVVYFNTADFEFANRNWWGPGSISFTNCCTTPVKAGWADGNITSDPAFINKDLGNYRLSKGSPCINAGTNQSWMESAFDLDGNQRIDRLWKVVDMGCYEFLPPWRGAKFIFR